MAENEALNGTHSYSPLNLFNDVSKGIFGNGKKMGTDVYTRNLQRMFIEKLGDLMNSDQNISELKSLSRGTLINIYDDLKVSKNMATSTDYHTLDIKQQIRVILDIED